MLIGIVIKYKKTIFIYSYTNLALSETEAEYFCIPKRASLLLHLTVKLGPLKELSFEQAYAYVDALTSCTSIDFFALSFFTPCLYFCS